MFSKLSVGQRLTGMVGLAVLVPVLLTGYAIYGLSASKNSLKTVYEDRMLCVEDLNKIKNLMVGNRAILRTALSEVKIATTADKKVGLAMDPEVSLKAATGIEKNIETISGLWKGYMATYLTPEEKILADNFATSRSKFADEALKPAVAALRANNRNETMKFADQARELYKPASADSEALIKLQLDLARDEYKASITRYENTRLISFSALGAAIAILIWLGFALVRSINRTLGAEPSEINRIASRIAAGDLSSTIKLAANDRSSAMVAMGAMQGKIKLLVADAAMLSKAAVEGKLSTRADASQHQGDFRKVVEGVNATLDSVIGPLNVAANYVDRISKGDIPTKITDSYNGASLKIHHNFAN
jgi:methyl-accepting chemotaxis protein